MLNLVIANNYTNTVLEVNQMSYIKKIEESKRKVYNQAVAQRILDLIDKLRLNSNENDERRWIWELLQNAKDVAFDKQSVSITVNFDSEGTNPSIEFKHNGRPFTIDNITFLIEQVSTKDRETIDGQKPKTTGKFGTGFLSTHLLSEKVEIEGVVKEPDLPYKKFDLLLDRSGRGIDEIISSVNESLKLLSSLDEKETFQEFDQAQFNTCFRYLLDADGLKTARKGLDDLEATIPFTLAFVPNIKSISINNKVSYRLQPQTIVFNDLIEIYTIQKESKSEVTEFYIAVVTSDQVQIAIEVTYRFGEISLVETGANVPRIFCDFPLIGSEDFGIPFVINSSRFNPTEQRNGIFLSDKSDPKIVENKMLIVQAKDLFFKLLDFAATNGWEKMYVLADFELPKPKDWISRDWIKNSILTPIRNKLLNTPIVDTCDYGRIPIECGEFNNNLPANAVVDFPKHAKDEILKGLWKLCSNPYFILPEEEDHTNWSKIIWDEKYTVTLKSILALIEQKKDLTALSSAIVMNITNTIEWLNNFYNLLKEEGDVIKDISNKSLYPNQNGIFKKKNELFIQSEIIDDLLKDIAKDLGIDVREQLAYPQLTIERLPNNTYSIADIATHISKLIKPRFSEINRGDETRKIFKTLYLWFTQNNKLAEDIFDDLYKNKHKLLDDREIVSSIEKAEAYEQLLFEEPNLSVERIQQLLEIETISNGFSTDANYTPDEQQKRINFENGWKGEAFVFKTLLAKGISVSWPNKSLTETSNKIFDFEGESHFIEDKAQKYDLVVSMNGHTKSYIQVKSTTTDISRADEIAMPISVREWKFVNEKAVDDTYYLARVFNVNSSPEVYFMKVENSILN